MFGRIGRARKMIWLKQTDPYGRNARNSCLKSEVEVMA